MSTRSFIARPTDTGYAGIYVHLDGYPSHRLPLLLAALQNRFGGDVKAMSQHLIDDVAVGWEELGTDLLNGAPASLLTALTGGEKWPSRQLDNLITTDGSPVQRLTVTQETAVEQDLQWGYVLYPHGIEVISLTAEEHGPLVSWKPDPRTRFSDYPDLWSPARPVPATAPPRATRHPAAPARPTAAPASAARSTHR